MHLLTLEDDRVRQRAGGGAAHFSCLHCLCRFLGLRLCLRRRSQSHGDTIASRLSRLKRERLSLFSLFCVFAFAFDITFDIARGCELLTCTCSI